MRSSDYILRVNTLCRVHRNKDNGAVKIYYNSVVVELVGNSATHDIKPLKCEGVEGCLEVGHKPWSS